MNTKMNSELLVIMEKCGHFLYHRRGGKRGQGRILKLLLTHGSMTQTELQEYLGTKAGSISEIVMKLEGKGFIIREKDETDKRKFKLTLTEAGKQVVQENTSINREQESKLFDALTEQEQKELQQLLYKVLKNWEDTFDKTFFEHRKGERKEKHEESED